jgi:hypothetical protein
MNSETRQALNSLISFRDLRRRGMTLDAFLYGMQDFGGLSHDEMTVELNFWDASPSFVDEGATVISLTVEQARVLTEVDAPEPPGWGFRASAVLVDIGDLGCMLAREGMKIVTMLGDDSLSGLVDESTVERLLGNLAYFVAHPESLPEAWTLREEHPSPVAERKRARAEHRKPRPLPDTLWVLGATRNLSDTGRERDRSESGPTTSEKSWKWGVRTWRSAHYHWYRVGKGRTGWRLNFLEGKEIGNPDAPLSVHALRLS